MFRFWFLRGIWRNTGKIAKNTARATDKKMAGPGWINAAALIWGWFSLCVLVVIIRPDSSFWMLICFVGAGLSTWFANRTLNRASREVAAKGKRK